LLPAFEAEVDLPQDPVLEFPVPDGSGGKPLEPRRRRDSHPSSRRDSPSFIFVSLIGPGDKRGLADPSPKL